MKRKLCRIIALFLVTVLLVPPFCATAEEAPLDNEKKQIVQNMMQHIASQSYDTITREGICYYPEMMENISSDTPATSTIELVSNMADMGSLIDISEEKYCEVLVNIMAISEYNNASDIAAQKEQDNLKTLQDYGMDVAEMSANAANIMTGTASLGTLGEGINLAISSLEVLASNTDNWIQALSNLETITQNYASFELFLDSMQNSTNASLRSAAKKLQQGMETAMKLKLETYADVSNENFENYEVFFFQDVFFTAIKNTPEYSADQTLAFFVDLGDAAVNAFSVLTSSWELGKQIGTLIGNLTVGGENLLNRLQEILVAVYIRRALIATMMDNITQFATNYSNENTEDLYEIAEEYVALARYLVNCDIRGMYCMYSIVATDAQLLSWLNMDTAQEAEEYCESLGGHLATITSAEEDAFVYQYMRENFSYESAYFGLTDAGHEGEWMWVTGEPVSYTNWENGEPNNGIENTDQYPENYGLYYYDFSNGKWNDGDFGVYTYRGGTAFICEWENKPETSKTGDALNIWNDFISSGDHLAFTSQLTDYEGNPLEVSYAIVDIDGDGWEEMILYASLNDGLGFGRHAVLSCDKVAGDISFIPIETGMEDGTSDYTNIAQNFRGVSYSLKNHALCYRTMNNGMMYGSTGFWVLKDGYMNSDFSVGFDQPQEYWDAWPESASSPQDPIYYISDNNGRTEISKEEYDAYIITGCESIEFQTFS